MQAECKMEIHGEMMVKALPARTIRNAPKGVIAKGVKGEFEVSAKEKISDLFGLPVLADHGCHKRVVCRPPSAVGRP